MYRRCRMRRRDEDQLFIRKGGRGWLATLVMIIPPSLVQGQTASAQCSAHRRRERERGRSCWRQRAPPPLHALTLRYVSLLRHTAHVVYSPSFWLSDLFPHCISGLFILRRCFFFFRCVVKGTLRVRAAVLSSCYYWYVQKERGQLVSV